MQNQIVYQFNSAQIANRFLNEVNSSRLQDIKAKLFRGSDKVQVVYKFADKGFDSTISELDDMAARYDGKEVF
ncbi:hypothetical protein [Aliiglaciecola sp. LCG003]|uniref:hypothetical protein n=1 Tax=Aliiglaciecola sp. LCG003 TaxID=3053655 RepID=UPI0025748CA9|nr:hypothetical protein [Aliiglaciecola sp. LCG003]WJG08605.1 hypothetical protein QR722_14845 [Aliiglaciecola sp. LCG003]